jgi:hypothetical protein
MFEAGRFLASVMMVGTIALLFLAAEAIVVWQRRWGFVPKAIVVDLSWVFARKHRQETVRRTKTTFLFIVLVFVLVGVLAFSPTWFSRIYLSACLIIAGYKLVDRIVQIFNAKLKFSPVHLWEFKLAGFAFVLVVNAFWLFYPNWLTFDIGASVAAIWLLIGVRLANFSTAFLGSIFATGLDLELVRGNGWLIRLITAAKDVPLSLIQPVSLSVHAHASFSLGLGDIVVPGTVVLLAFETARLYKNNAVVYGSVIGYMVGLLMAVMALRITGHPQPATIYLLPCTLLGFAIPAAMMGKWEAFRNDFLTPKPVLA